MISVYVNNKKHESADFFTVFAKHFRRVWKHETVYVFIFIPSVAESDILQDNTFVDILKLYL